jgi:acetyl esterase/lipase
MSWLAPVALALAMLAPGSVSAQAYDVVTRTNIAYAERNGTTLAGDLYLPQGRDKAPVLVAVHGGGWQGGSRMTYRHWGPYLAKNGYAVFAISYRLSKPGAKSFPDAVYDVKASSCAPRPVSSASIRTASASWGIRRAPIWRR